MAHALGFKANAAARLAPRRAPRACRPAQRAGLVVEAGKKAARKGGKGKGGGAGGKVTYKSAGQVKEGSAYAQETRQTILSFGRLKKTAPSGRQILSDVSLSMYLGAKIGVLGSNGAGKSTLMKIMAGVDKDFDGDYDVNPGIRVGYLAQEPPLEDGETVIENIEPALKETRAKVAEFEDVSVRMGDPDEDVDALMARMTQLQSELDACNGWEVDRQLDRAMDALRCPPKDAKVAVLSGGERRRVAICRLLLESPDVLLLDEPTNHLDAASVAWLERFLADFRGTVVAITHDRYFLDNVAGWILELDQGKGIPFEGNYSAWLDSKAKRLESAKQRQQALQKAIAEELEWINKSQKGQQKKGKARVGRYEDLVEEAAEYTRNSTLESITIPVGPRLGSVVVEASGLVKGYKERCLIDNLDFMIPPGAIVGIIGGNGAGKTTLFRMIMGQEQPDAGELKVGETVKAMYVDQSRDDLANDVTVYDMLADGADNIDLGGREIATRAYCSWFNFRGSDQSKLVGDLSGGERNRLQLAKTLRSGGNLLLLDEPTNDLDVDTLRALEQAVLNFAGSVMCVSHDRWFLDRVATHILAYEGDSQVVWFNGTYSEYERDLRERSGGKDPSAVKYRPMPALA